MSHSSWKDQIEKKWGPHRHCPICGKAMASERRFCSQGCNDNYLTQEKKHKKKGRTQMICLVAMIGVLVIFMIIPMFFG